MNKQWTRHSLLLLVGMATASSVFASQEQGLFRGFYSSLSGGGVQTASKIDTHTVAFYDFIGFPTFTGSPLTSREWNNAGTGALTLGYGDFIANNFHLAGEIFVNVARRHASQNFSTVPFAVNATESMALGTSTTTKLRNWEYGVDIKPGFLYNACSLVYTRIGAAFNKVTIDSASTISLVGTANGVAGGDGFVTFSDDRSRAGLRLGIGLEHAMTPNLSFIADYIYTHYGRVSANGASDTIGTDGQGNSPVTPLGLQDTASARVSTQAGTIGFKYYFL